MFDFWINGVSAMSKGIYTEDITPPCRPSKRLNLESVPGRSGFLANGDDSYNQYVRYVTCFAEDNANLAAVWEFLDGATTVRFSTDAGHYQQCVSVDEVDPEAFTSSSCSFTVAFTCQPYRYIYPVAEEVTLEASGVTVNNAGRLPSAPRIKISGSGAMTLTVGGELVRITGGTVIIDSELMDCFDEDGITLANSRVSLLAGHFPALQPGANTISYTGAVTSVRVLKRERDL